MLWFLSAMCVVLALAAAVFGKQCYDDWFVICRLTEERNAAHALENGCMKAIEALKEKNERLESEAQSAAMSDLRLSASRYDQLQTMFEAWRGGSHA